MKWYGIIAFVALIGMLGGIVYFGANTDKIGINFGEPSAISKEISNPSTSFTNLDPQEKIQIKNCETGEKDFVYTNCEYRFSIERPSNEWRLVTTEDKFVDFEVSNDEISFALAISTIDATKSGMYYGTVGLDVYNLKNFDFMSVKEVADSYVKMLKDDKNINEIKVRNNGINSDEFLIYYSNYEKVYFDCLIQGYRDADFDYILQACMVESLDAKTLGKILNENSNILRSFTIL